jgi:1-acyl-sn-glycerol-3-phosphate acyltransferase
VQQATYDDIFGENIPFPKLKSHLHPRMPLHRRSVQDRAIDISQYSPRYIQRWKKISRLIRKFHFDSPGIKWPFYRVVMGVIRTIFRITHQMELRGRENIPSTGCIFYLNHIGSEDVILFLSAYGKPLGIFTEVGDGWHSDILERKLGFVIRRGSTAEMIERMVRTILCCNRFFATWPEGTISADQTTLHGFSGIVKVYAVLNSDKDRIPFVPVVARGAECFWWQEKRPHKKIIFDCLPPVFLPRAWLRPIEQGGKTPREMIDWLMLRIARRRGQTVLGQNHLLDVRKNHPSPIWEVPWNKKKKKQ